MDTDLKMAYGVLLDNEFLSSNSSHTVIAHILPSKSQQPNAFRAKVKVSSELNLPVLRRYVAKYYLDCDIVKILQFGRPINLHCLMLLI